MLRYDASVEIQSMADKPKSKHIKLTSHLGTSKPIPITWFPAWGDAEKIVSLDPFGHVVAGIPADARVEMDAKMAAGYFTPDGTAPEQDELVKPKGRGLS
jgi:hypothetical protein